MLLTSSQVGPAELAGFELCEIEVRFGFHLGFVKLGINSENNVRIA